MLVFRWVIPQKKEKKTAIPDPGGKKPPNPQNSLAAFFWTDSTGHWLHKEAIHSYCQAVDQNPSLAAKFVALAPETDILLMVQKSQTTNHREWDGAYQTLVKEWDFN